MALDQDAAALRRKNRAAATRAKKQQEAKTAKASQKRNQKAARRKGELFDGDAQRNLFVGVEYLDPARPRPELDAKPPN